MTEGFWNWGLAGCVPNCENPVTLCAFRLRTMMGSVGMPLVIPFAISRLGLPSPYGDLPPSLWPMPIRKSTNDVDVIRYVAPSAIWRLYICTFELALPPAAPPNVGGSKMAVWCWLYTPKMLSF